MDCSNLMAPDGAVWAYFTGSFSTRMSWESLP
jgi:hypothetical protein